MSLAPHNQRFLSVFIGNEEGEMNEYERRKMEETKEAKQRLANDIDWYVPSSSWARKH
jgi:hypothetical protein